MLYQTYENYNFRQRYFLFYYILSNYNYYSYHNNTMKEDLNNEHYHSKEKNCQIKPYKLIRDKKEMYIVNCQRCTLHRKTICRCGWEFGWHNDEDKKEL